MKMCQIRAAQDSKSAGWKPKKDFVVSGYGGVGRGALGPGWGLTVASLVHLISVFNGKERLQQRSSGGLRYLIFSERPAMEADGNPTLGSFLFCRVITCCL